MNSSSNQQHDLSKATYLGTWILGDNQWNSGGIFPPIMEKPKYLVFSNLAYTQTSVSSPGLVCQIRIDREDET